MNRFSVSKVVMHHSEAFSGIREVKSIFEADKFIKLQIDIQDLGFAKTRLTVHFEDGETANFDCDYSEGESLVDLLHNYHWIFRNDEMPKWYSAFPNPKERWEKYKMEWFNLIGTHDFGLGF